MMSLAGKKKKRDGYTVHLQLGGLNIWMTVTSTVNSIQRNPELPNSLLISQQKTIVKAPLFVFQNLSTGFPKCCFLPKK